MNDFYTLNDINLPPFLRQKNNSAYGDNYVAAVYCGFKEVPKPVDGEWQHGWIGPERNIHPEFAIGSDGKSISRKWKKYFVARKDQLEYLSNFGLTKVFAIGLPAIYVQKPEIERKKGSLLVMPVHSLSDTEEKWNDEEYAAYIESVSDHFNEIVLCLHRSCIDKKNWINAFQKRKIKVVIGADPDDSNSYIRLALLFSRFEFVTSNDIGSHIAYASFFGAKSSIAGPRPKFERKDFEKTLFYANAPDVLDIVEKWYKENHYREIYPFLYGEPQLAESSSSWAEFQLGLSEKRTPEQLKKILGWTLIDRNIFNLKKVILNRK